ncbi:MULTISPECIES: helix-turn-helix domain-containing protein [Bacillus cereus group]|uniref:helix-turn-helix domain-containing protein n=2 Tax=Bacillus cereus group TaxID=86661 RepID=UPI0031E9870D
MIMKFDNAKLSSLLRNKNMKQIEFAQAINRAPSTVSLYVSGKGEPGRKALIAMSEVFDLPMHELMKQEE